MARFLIGVPPRSGRLGALPAAFNPPTLAHLALADAAQRAGALDRVVFVLPEDLPHKRFDGASFEQRRRMLEAAVAGRPDRAVAVSSGGLFVEIARELRALAGPDIEIELICGRDAAERIVGWDYGAAPPIAEQLREFGLLAAARGGEYATPEELRGRIRTFDLAPELAETSSSRVRQSVAQGEPWRQLLPPAVAEIVEREGLYRERQSSRS